MGKNRFMEKNRCLIFTYVLGHFVIDFACAYLMYCYVFEMPHWYNCFLIYNFCAFALQMPLGLIADRLNRNALCAAIGCGMVLIAYVFSNINMLAIVVIAGIGNAMFHIGGGIDILNISKEKAGLLGLFVSPGAFGIYLGTILGKQQEVTGGIVASALLMVTAVVLTFCVIHRSSYGIDNLTLSFKGVTSAGQILAIVCFLIVVIVRSYIGMSSNYSWKSQGMWGVAFIFAVVLGKMTGGWLADWLGVRNATIISLGLSAVLFLLSGNPWFGVSAIFFFNMTMPITLWALTRVLNHSKGFSFGILTFGLFLGYIPSYLGYDAMLTVTAGFSAAALLSLLLLWIGLRRVVD